MNCDKKFLGCCRLEIGGLVLGVLHVGGSIASLLVFLGYFGKFEINLWILLGGFAFWVFHSIASVLIIIGTLKRKSTLIIPFIILYTLIFTSVATFAAFCVLEGVASEPKAYRKTSKVLSNSTEAMKKRMKEFKVNYIPKLPLDGVNYAILMLIVGFVCLFCVYILSCVCALYDKLKVDGKEEKSLLSNASFGMVRESESEE